MRTNQKKIDDLSRIFKSYIQKNLLQIQSCSEDFAVKFESFPVNVNSSFIVRSKPTSIQHISKTAQQKDGRGWKINLIKHHRLLQPTGLDYKRLECQVNSLITDERIAIYTMVGRFYRYYRDNPKILTRIPSFAKSYQSTNAAHWFTKATFIYRFINMILREGDTELTHNMRCYIADLSAQLVELKCKQKELMKGVKVLYRGLRQAASELELLKKYVGNSIVTKCFMSTSSNIAVALFFAGIDQPQSDESRPLLLELIVDFDSASVIAADISSLSKFPEEREVLFDIATKFRVEKLTFDSSNKIWVCKLSALSTSFVSVTSSRIIPIEKNILIAKANIVEERELYRCRRHFTDTIIGLTNNNRCPTRRTLLWIASNSVDLARMQLHIGFRSWQQRNIHQAKIYFENARKIYEQEVIDQNEHIRIFANLGFMFYKTGESTRAIEFAERSIAMMLRIEPANTLILARYYRILGLAYGTGGRIKDALACHDQALMIDESLRSTERWSMVLTLRNFALIHRDRGDLASAAEYFRRTWKVFQEVSADLLESHQ